MRFHANFISSGRTVGIITRFATNLSSLQQGSFALSNIFNFYVHPHVQLEEKIYRHLQAARVL
ncbi:MAG: hypothetical protein AUG51_25705 [Acidobacteria bacterium 13_1_20CM_3_53_8]|nr:MAG: hypothetical protein AUG51_25705 [Acidobacteria bacterium 13_1_20CM_3_53_8]